MGNGYSFAVRVGGYDYKALALFIVAVIQVFVHVRFLVPLRQIVLISKTEM